MTPLEKEYKQLEELESYMANVNTHITSLDVGFDDDLITDFKLHTGKLSGRTSELFREAICVAIVNRKQEIADFVDE